MRAALGKELSAASVNRHLALLKATFNRAMRADPPKADRNLVRGVKLLKENNERVRVLTDAEEGRLLAALPDYLHPFVVVALHTGTRRGELAHLEWEHVDFHTRTLLVTRSKSGEGRRVPMNRVVVETLQALRKARKVFAAWCSPRREGSSSTTSAGRGSPAHQRNAVERLARRRGGSRKTTDPVTARAAVGATSGGDVTTKKMVDRGRIELPTPGFSVPCSTN